MAFADGNILLRNTNTGKLERIFQGYSGIYAMAFSRDGKVLASVDSVFPANTINVWNVDTGDLRATVSCSHWVNDLVFSSDGGLLLSCSEDGMIRVWDPFTGTLRRQLKAEAVIRRLSLSSDGSRIETDRGNLRLSCLRTSHGPSHGKVAFVATFVGCGRIVFGRKKLVLSRSGVEFGRGIKFAVGGCIGLGNARGDVLVVRKPESAFTKEDLACFERFLTGIK